jgi:hypothetical protein
VCIDTLIVKFQSVPKLSCKYSDFIEFSYEPSKLELQCGVMHICMCLVKDFSYE